MQAEISRLLCWLANTIATGAALVALILTFGSISGAHFNPAVTLADAVESGIPWREVPRYITAQFAGGILGAILAHLMFGLHWYSFSADVDYFATLERCCRESGSMSPIEIARARRQTGLSNNAAEEALDQLLQEPKTDPRMRESASTFVTYARRLAQSVTALHNQPVVRQN